MNKFQEATLVQAIQYARRGWAVLPTKKNKRPLNLNGSRGATTDEDQIIKWWETYPSANIGIATGKISGFFVVDVDIKNDKDGLASLKDRYGDGFTLSPDALIQKTPSGGFHFLFKCPDHEVHNSQDVLSGVDIRGEGGYILTAPSSVNINDEWLEYRFNDLNNDTPEAPQWVVDLTNLGSAANKRPVDIRNAIAAGLPEGCRDESIFKIACLLEREGVDVDTAVVFVETIADKCVPAFDRTEARAKVESVYTNYTTSRGLLKQIEMLKSMKENNNG